MNTIGKILVILNLIFALVIGGFLVIDFATRTNWKTAFEQAKRELDIAKTERNISGNTLRDAISFGKTDRAENLKLKQDLKDLEKVMEAKEESLQAQLQEAIAKAKEADLVGLKANAERDRLKEEVKGLGATIEGRNETILVLQNDKKKFQQEAGAQKQIADQMQSRNENLLARLQDLERKIALRDAGVGDVGFTKDPNAPNPPSAYVKGKVEKVDPTDRRLVQISVGTDQGVNKNHTLEVYRLTPRPEYLGMIRIVDAKEHTAVGQLMRTASSNRAPLQAGDIVASSLSKQ
jgi:hypothetical protein